MTLLESFDQQASFQACYRQTADAASKLPKTWTPTGPSSLRTSPS
jgi:hypothetical protein